MAADPATDQRHQALAKANGVRGFKAQRKLKLRGMENPYAFAAVMLRDPKDEEGAFTIAELVMSLPGAGRSRLRKLGNRAQVPLHRKLRDLPDSQRERAALALEEVTPERWRSAA